MSEIHWRWFDADYWREMAIRAQRLKMANLMDGHRRRVVRRLEAEA